MASAKERSSTAPNCKIRVLHCNMLTQQIDLALERYLDDNYGPSSFAMSWYRKKAEHRVQECVRLRPLQLRRGRSRGRATRPLT